MNNSGTLTKIAPALVKAQKAMGNAVKDAKNPFFKSKYADLNAVREACIPALNENGITVLQPTISVDGKPFVETLLLHESGEFISSLTEIVVAKVNDPQAHGSGVSYARRYGLQSMVNLGSEDDDGEGAMGRNKPAPSVGNVTPPQKTAAQASGASTTPPVQKTEEKPAGKKTASFAKPKPQADVNQTEIEL